MTATVIVDPALGRTGAHNRGFAELLALQGKQAGCGALGVWCNASIETSLRDHLETAGLVVKPVFSVEYYQLIHKPGGIADHWTWVQALARQYRDALAGILQAWPDEVIRVIHHTLSWEHASALSIAIRLLGARGDRVQHLLLLMYSPGIDQTGRTYDEDRRLNYRLAFHSLDTLPNVNMYAGCSEYAHAYADLLGQVSPLPVHPCFIGDWSVPPDNRPAPREGHERIVLYVGEIKREKGFLALPDTLRRLLQGAPATRRFVVQFVNARNDASRRVLAAIEHIAAEHANVELHHGFWSDEQLHQQLASCDVLHLTYDAEAYAHKTSGLLWLAAWYGIPVVVPAQGWLQREARRLGLASLTDASATSAGPVHHAAVDDSYRRMLFTPFWTWLEQQGRVPDRRQPIVGPGRQSLVANLEDGADVVVFWKQNDSTLYGRRVDMVVRYLASRADVRRVLVIDAPIGDANLEQLGEHAAATHHGRLIQARTLAKHAGGFDAGKVSYDVFVCPLGEFRFREDGSGRPRFIEGYVEFLQGAFARQGIDPRRALFWVYPRNFHAPALVQKFQPARVVVDVVDDDRAWPGVQERTRRALSDNLRSLLQSADMVFANCAPVQQAIREFRPDIRLVPNGCDPQPPAVQPRNEAFRSFCQRPGKVIGFVGNLESKIDIALLNKLAERFNDCHIVLIGSTHANPQVLELARHANVSLPGVVPYDEIGAWLRRFDVGLIPHLDMELTRHMNPLKAYVYLSMHVPVVATAVRNIDTGQGLIHIATTHAEFLDEVARVLAGARPEKRAFADYVDANSWPVRFAAHIDELVLAQLSPASVESGATLPRRPTWLRWLRAAWRNQGVIR
ncbi:glycosyltransferase [Lysobacter sp. A286]